MGAHEPHYEPPKEHYGAHEPHHEPPKEHYGAPEPHHEPHDPHHEVDDKKCVDISTWGELKYKKVEKEHCKVHYHKHTEKRSLNVKQFQSIIVRRNGTKINTEKRYGLEMVIANSLNGKTVN